MPLAAKRWMNLKKGFFMTVTLDYGSIMNTAMRFFVRKVLEKVAKEGLPGDHHFYITLDSAHSELEMASWLREKYPKDITIVMQHWFDNLMVKENGFNVTLNFGNIPESFYIPYEAILTFVDPSVEFGVKFEHTGPKQEKNELNDASQSIDENAEKKVSLTNSRTDANNAEIVQLDTFRKN